MICKSCNLRFSSRSNLLQHLLTCRPRTKKTDEIQPESSISRLRVDDFDEGITMDDCIDSNALTDLIEQEFVVIGTECVPAQIKINDSSVNENVTESNAILLELKSTTERVGTSELFNDENRPPSPNQSIDNCITDPDWTPAANGDDNVKSSDDDVKKLNFIDCFCVFQDDCIDSNAFTDLIEQEFIVIGTESVPAQIKINDSSVNENGIESNSILTTERVGTSEILKDENRPPSPNQSIDNCITDPDWTPAANGDDNVNSSDDDNIEKTNDEIEPTSSLLCLEESNISTNEMVLEGRAEIDTCSGGDQLSGKKRKRWSKADPTTWSRAVQKKLRNTGQCYQVKGKDFPDKVPKEPCNITCRYKCTHNFTVEERKTICVKYWALQLYIRKKDFILKHVKSVEPERRRSQLESGNQRKDSKKYFLPRNGVETRVCQKFFLNTLCISNGPVNSAFKEVSSVSMFSGEDKRGKHIPSNKLSQENETRIKKHIESFPVTESHYCRKGTSRKYLDSNLSINKMFSLFEELCKENNENAYSVTTYKRIFCNNYNYSFFKPKKDQCTLCTKYKLASGEAKTAMEHDYVAHKEREKVANQAKENDKVRASNEASFLSATFDLQKVLQIPCTQASPMFYSRKLNCFNLTIYESAQPNDAHCYVWNEVNGKRGSMEIGTCVYKFLVGLPKTIKEVSLFSDTCGGQNRNQNMVAILLHTVQTSQIDVIEQKFLESGHTMMECDSMHSAIESEKKHAAVYTMHDWINIFRRARSQRNRKNANPYNVHILEYKDFIDLSTLSKATIKNKRKDTDGNLVNWLKIKCFRFEKANAEFVFFRYGFSGPYSKFRVSGRSGSDKVALPELKNAYTNNLQISLEKYKDLNNLCRSGVIPSEFHHWYQSLTFSKRLKNINSEPSVLSESENEED